MEYADFQKIQLRTARVLTALGVASAPGVDAAALEQWAFLPVLGHGEPVGRIRPLIG